MAVVGQRMPRIEEPENVAGLALPFEEVAQLAVAAGPLPYNGKKVAEHSLIPTPAAIANAIYDAVGARITSTPIAAEKVYAGLRRG